MHFSLLFPWLTASLVACTPFPKILKRDTSDIPTISKIAAIGDSYSAGIGAGNRLGSVLEPVQKWSNWKCSRYDGSYPVLVSTQILGSDSEDFQFLSCSGAVTPEIIQQIDDVNLGQDLILASAGGNDAEFVFLLNACIFQFASTTGAGKALWLAAAGAAAARGGVGAAGVAKWYWNNKDRLARTCQEQIDESKKIIDSDDFKKNINTLITKAKGKLSNDGAIFYTGYAKFFDEDMSENDKCDTDTWSFFFSKVENSPEFMKQWQEPIKLTVENRKKMNDLVGHMNSKIKEIIGDDDRVIFNDYGDYFGSVRGQFCTKGATSWDKDRLVTGELALFPLNVWDDFGTNPMKRNDMTERYASVATFEGQLNLMAYVAANATDNALVRRGGDEIAEKISDAWEKVKDTWEVVESYIPSVLPDAFGRVMHPTVLGHSIIASDILYHMDIRDGQKHGYITGEVKEQVTIGGDDACPLQTDDAKCSPDPAGAQGKAFNDDIYKDWCEQLEKDPTEVRNTNQQHTAGIEQNENHYEVYLKWIPNKSKKQCKKTCAAAYKEIAGGKCGKKGSGQNEMSTSGSIDADCGQYFYEIKKTDQNLGKTDCYDTQLGPKDHKYTFGAPIGSQQVDGEGGKGKSVQDAINEWCDSQHDINISAEDNNLVYARFGYGQSGITDRNSFWLSAKYNTDRKISRGECAHGSDSIDRVQCKAALGVGLDKCNHDGARTQGFSTESASCIDYRIHISDVVYDSPPWNDLKIQYPPPDGAIGDGATWNGRCMNYANPQPPMSKEVYDQIIAWCGEDGGWTGPDFKSSVRFGDIMVQASPREGDPWGDECKRGNGFNPDKRNKDDCLFAFKSRMQECNPEGTDHFSPTIFYYRCVDYSFFGPYDTDAN